jgi:hypothetical protein
MNRSATIALLAAALTSSSCGKDPPAAAPQAAPTRLIPPLCDAQVGEWLRIEAGRDAQLYRVVDAGDYWVDVETTTYQNEAPIGTPQRQRWPRNSFGLPMDDCVIRAIDADRIQIADKWYDCWRICANSRSGLEMFYWISDQVPVHGVLQVAGVQKGVADLAHAAKLTESGFRAK